MTSLCCQKQPRLIRLADAGSRMQFERRRSASINGKSFAGTLTALNLQTVHSVND